MNASITKQGQCHQFAIFATLALNNHNKLVYSVKITPKKIFKRKVMCADDFCAKLCSGETAKTMLLFVCSTQEFCRFYLNNMYLTLEDISSLA